MSRTTYTVRAYRSGNWWAIEVPQVPGALSQARRLDQVEEMARDAISIVLEVDDDSFDVAVQPDLPESMAELTEAVDQLRADAEQAEARLRQTRRRAIDALLAEGLPQRDVGALLHLSHQRVSQLLREPVDA